MSKNGLVWLNVRGKVVGPVSIEVVRAKITRGELRPGTHWSADRVTWRDLSLLPTSGQTIPAPHALPTLEKTAASPPSSLPSEGPPPIPPERWLPVAVLVTLAALAFAAVLVGATLLIARPDLFKRAPNQATMVAKAPAEDSPWGADKPAGDKPADAAAPMAPDQPPPAKAGGDQPADPPDNNAKPADNPPAPMPAPVEAKPEAKPELKVEDIVRKCEPSVAVLKNAKGSGSGFLIDTNLLATNQHVAGNIGDQVSVRFPSAPGLKDKEFKGLVVRSDDIRDLALVRLREAPGPQALELGDEKSLKKGQDIIVIGSPGLGNADVIENAVRKGTYSTTKDLPPFGEVLELGVAINPGNSGGPVFDMTGKVIGVAVAKGAMVEAVGFAVPVAQLREMIRKHRTGAR